MASKLVQTLGYFDFFGVQPVLYYKGNGKSKSWFGSFCSYLMIGWIILAIMYSFQNMVLRKNPKVVTSVVKRNSDPIEFGTNGLNLALNFMNIVLGRYTVDPSIFNFEFSHYDLKYDKVGGNLIGANISSVDYENCTKEHFTNAFTDNGKCIKPGQNVTVGPQSEKILVYTMKRCSNSTNSQQICKPKEIIDQVYSSNYFYLTYPIYLITPDNYDHPISTERGAMSFTGSVDLSKRILVELMEYELHTDSGFIFEDISVQRFLQVEKVWVDTAVDSKNEYNVNVYTLEQKTIMKRNYPKIQESFAGTVALVKIGFLIVVFLIGPCTKINTFKQVIAEIFSDKNSFNFKQKIILPSNKNFELNQNFPNPQNYKQLQNSNNSSMVGDESLDTNKNNNTSRNQPNSILQNAILSNHKKQNINEKNQNIYINTEQSETGVFCQASLNEQGQTASNNSESQRIDSNEGEVIDTNKIVLNFDKNMIIDQTKNQINKIQEGSEGASKERNLKQSQSEQDDYEKNQSSLVLWLRQQFSCLKTSQTKIFKKRQQAIKNELSMVNLIQKLGELDRLKQLVLEDDQLNLFNNMKYDTKLFEQRKNQQSEEKLEQDLKSVLNKEIKSLIDKKLLNYYLKD